jgi:hypothetical protein
MADIGEDLKKNLFWTVLRNSTTAMEHVKMQIHEAKKNKVTGSFDSHRQ